MKTSKDGEPALVKIYGPVFSGNNKHYVSGSKHCTHGWTHGYGYHVDQTSKATKQKGNMKKSAVENEVNHESGVCTFQILI